MERAQDLHIAELSIAVQILVFQLFLCTRLILLQQILHSETDRANFFSYILLGLPRYYITVQKILRDGIHTLLDGPIGYLFLHTLFILGIKPERQTKLDSIVHMDDHILPEL